MLRFTAIALMLSATAFAGAASAHDWKSDTARQPVAETMSLRDVNFDNPAQVKVLYRRLQIAAIRVCASEDRAGPEITADDAACTRDVLADSVRQIRQPQLTQYAAQMNQSGDQLAMNRN